MASETYRITIDIESADKSGPGFTSAQRKVSEFDKTVQQTQSRLTKLTGTNWSAKFSAVDKATSVITKVESKLHTAIGKAWNFTVGVIDKATAPLQGIFNLLKNPILQAGAALGITVSVSDAVSTFAGFESAMSKVEAISGATSSEMEDLTALAKEMGATTKFTAEEAAEGLTYMAMAGWKTEDMLTSLPGIMNLAAAAGEDLATTSDIVTDAMTAFGMAADGYTANGVANATHFADVLAEASARANTTVSGMGETFKYVGSMAGSLGYSIEDVALATGLMANQGTKGTMAGTSLNAIITRLSTNTSGATDAIKELGVEFYNADGSARALGDVMGDLRKATANMTAAQKSELANTVAGMEAQKGLLAILNTSEEDYNKLTEAIYNCDGAAQEMADTMMNNLQGSMTKLSSAFDGVKLALGSRLSPYIREFVDWLTAKMPDAESAINQVMDSVDGKIEKLRGTIAEFTGSDEWASADIWGKISIAWDKIVAEPFSTWWEGTGKEWLTEKVGSIGETLGSGITAGLLGILGFDVNGALEDGKSIGASFIDGFTQGFDGAKITEALGKAFSDFKDEHPFMAFGLEAAAGLKTVTGAAKLWQKGRGIASSIGSLFGGSKSGSGGGMFSKYTTTTMTVTAAVVNINSGASGAGNIVSKAAQALTGGSATAALPAAGGTGAGTLATIGKVASKAAVPVAAGVSLIEMGYDAYHGVGKAEEWTGSNSTGNKIASGVGAALGGTGDGVLGEESTGEKVRHIAGGVAKGAGIGAAIGSVVPVIGTGIGAAVGAGIGGIGAAIGGSNIAKGLSAAGSAVGGFFTETLPNFVTKTIPEAASCAGKAISGFASTAGDKIGGFFTETLPGFVTETIPSAASKAGKAISGWASSVGDTVGNFFTETVPTFLTEQVPYAAGYVFGKAETFFGETIPEKFGELWDSVSTFFGETLPTWADGVFQRAQTFFTESVPEFFGNLWDNVSTFFTETIPTWADGVFQKAQTFFTESVPEFFGNLWSNVTTFVTETIPTWAETAFTKVSTFFTESVPSFFSTLWSDVVGFVTETIPTWAETAFSKVSNFFTVTVPGFFDTLWSNVTGFVTETLGGWASSIASKVSGWWSTVSGWFDNLWSTISGAFSSGRQAGSGKHAEGGIMYAPHTAQVAEDGPEAIIPLGASDRSRGVAVWEQAGDILGVNSPKPVGSNDDGSGEIPADGPESGPEGGGGGDDVPVYTTTTNGGTGPQDAPQDAPISVPVNIALNPEIIIQASAGMSTDDIVQALKEHIRELVDDISDEMAERLARIFANMPVKGGA